MHYFHSSVEPEKLKKLAEEKGLRAFCVQADLTNEQEVISCIRAAVGYFGSFDILVNNSGALVERRFLSQLDMDYWNKVICHQYDNHDAGNQGSLTSH